VAEFEMRDIVAPVREYMDKEGNKKTETMKIGTARVSEHGSVIQLFIKTTPLNWNGTAFVNRPYEKKEDRPLKQHEVIEKVHDNEPTEEDVDKPIDLSQIPF